MCSRCGETIPADEAVCPHCGFENLAVQARSSAGPGQPGAGGVSIPGGDRLEPPWPGARRSLDNYRRGLIAKLVKFLGILNRIRRAMLPP